MSPTALIYGSRRPLDQFAGVPERLRERGVEVLHERLWDGELRSGLQAQPQLIERADVLAFADLSYNQHLRPVRLARRAGKPSVLLVDGVTEFSNICLNPWMGADYLRPAPENVVGALGGLQEAALRAMGNGCVVRTGLPRLDGTGALVERARGVIGPAQWLLVATAFTPALSADARGRLLDACAMLREAAAGRGLTVRWRLTAGLGEQLGVEVDRAPLHESLAGAWGVVTSASTVAVESMIAGVPTGVMHPHAWPLWVPGAWVWKPEGQDDGGWRAAMDGVRAADDAVRGVIQAELGGLDPGVSGPDELLDALRAPDAERLEAQRRLLGVMHTPGSADIVARLLDGIASRGLAHVGIVDRVEREPPRTVGKTVVRASPKRARRVLNILRVGRSPVHGVASWAMRLTRAFAAGDSLGYEVHTLFVAAEPMNYEQSNAPPIGDDPRLHLCVLDPTLGTHERLDAALRAASSLDPDVVIPGHDDECFAIAAQLHATGVRCVGVVHVDEPGEAERLRMFDRWDVGVGVSAVCAGHLRSVAGDRAVHSIPYGVPIAAGPRPVAADGPLRLGYIGRFAEHQKRVGDLLTLIEELERLGVRYEFHAVGDGPDLPGWRARLEAMGLPPGRVRLHGRRSMEWVERFLPGMDLSVLVSAWEGMSVSMLEAMGQGVVPCVTRVNSGVSEWIDDGVHGVVVPVGQPRMMAERVCELDRDRGLLARLGHNAHGRMAERDMGLRGMAERYAAVFDEALARPRDTRPTDLGVRVTDRFVWTPPMPDDDAEADAWVCRRLGEAGYRDIALGSPSPGCDAVLVPARAPRPDDAVIDGWRRSGLGVGVSPNLCVEQSVRLAERAVGRLAEGGCRRIVIFGAGTQSAAFLPLLRRQGGPGPVVGWIDDSALPGTTHVGLSAVTLEEAGSLRPDGVVLNSRRYEPLLALRCDVLGGVRVTALTRADAALDACVRALRAAREHPGEVVCVCEKDTLGYAHAVRALETVMLADLEAWVGRGRPPGLVVLAIEGDEAAAIEKLSPHVARGVRVVSVLTGWSSAPLDHLDHRSREAAQAHTLSAASGDRGGE